MPDRRIRRAVLEAKVEFIRVVQKEIFIASEGMLYILSMDGEVTEDIKLPSGEVAGLWRLGDKFYIRTKTRECYRFALGDTAPVKINARSLKQGKHLVFSSEDRVFFLDEDTLRVSCSAAMPGCILDIAEMGERMYILFSRLLVYAKTPLLMAGKTELVPIDNLSHMRFTAVATNGRDFIALEGPREVVVHDGSETLWLIWKPRGFIRCEVTCSLLIMASEVIELYALRDGSLYARINARTRVFAYDCIRRALWLYSGSLYEVELSEPYC
jgi:hypothetical protein